MALVDLQLTHVGASERSAGQCYEKIAAWKLQTAMPEFVKILPVS